ncbi:resolvase [Steroidobacter agaridevorans]|uniref:Resolvase n=1 Tax=Steroidobacter agaridevorans TaxID=2695856 RepID=A0A829Y7N2_9GAMM|nr:resolvase [Steroidobacter agaridevorans]
MRAALYARFSTDLQRAASIEDQFRNCRKRAALEGWTVVATFADAAMSGSDANRPQYRSMLAAAGRHEFDILIVDDLSRLTRDAVECERAIRRMEFIGLRIVATSDGYDSTSKARKVHRGFKGLMNEIFLDDLRERVHRGLTGQAQKHYWCGGRPYGYRLKPVLDASQLDVYSQPARIGTVLEIEESQAAIVREIFTRFADGASCLVISRELNERGIPSPGSTWKRKARRCKGWMGSAVRVILRNPLYGGRVRWNVSQFVRDPDSGSYKRRRRPKAEWVEHQDESLRIIPNELFEKAQARTRAAVNSDKRLKSGGKAKYLLSGLLVCNVCKAHYVIADARSYACSGHWNGRACSNNIRVRRDAIERTILGGLRRDLLMPERVHRIAKEMQAAFAERVKQASARAETMPQELEALDARLERLRERLKAGDPDLTADELQTAIDRVEAKRRELIDARPAARESARVLTMLPKAAEFYRDQIDRGLGGDLCAAAKARTILREMLGEIMLSPGKDGSLWAEYAMQPAALLQGAGTCGRGSPRPREPVANKAAG